MKVSSKGPLQSDVKYLFSMFKRVSDLVRLKRILTVTDVSLFRHLFNTLHKTMTAAIDMI